MPNVKKTDAPAPKQAATPLTAPSEGDKAFSDWLGKVLEAKTDAGLSSLKIRLRKLHFGQQDLLARIRKAENDLNQARAHAVKQEGAAEQIAELLRDEFEAEQGKAKA